MREVERERELEGVRERWTRQRDGCNTEGRGEKGEGRRERGEGRREKGEEDIVSVREREKEREREES